VKVVEPWPVKPTFRMLWDAAFFNQPKSLERYLAHPQVNVHETGFGNGTAHPWPGKSLPCGYSPGGMEEERDHCGYEDVHWFSPGYYACAPGALCIIPWFCWGCFDNHTALHVAAGKGHIGVQRQLLAAGADPWAGTTFRCVSPVCVSCLNWPCCLGFPLLTTSIQKTIPEKTRHIVVSNHKWGRTILVRGAECLVEAEESGRCPVVRFNHCETVEEYIGSLQGSDAPMDVKVQISNEETVTQTVYPQYTMRTLQHLLVLTEPLNRSHKGKDHLIEISFGEQKVRPEETFAGHQIEADAILRATCVVSTIPSI